jgi:Zn-dependent protease with chaperone function
MTWFALLSIFMVVASYVFVIGLAAACVYLPYLALAAGIGGFQIVALFLFGVVIAGAMLWSLLPRPDKFKAPGLLIERAAQPRLFAELENIAGALHEPMPKEVYLIGDVNAWVADRGGLMGIGSRRVMGLGLPLLSILTVSQFRAVLAHEFAHYYGGDTSLGPWVYKTQTAIVRAFQNIGSVGQLARIAILGVMYVAVTTLLKWYFVVFLRAINLVSRRRTGLPDRRAPAADRRPARHSWRRTGLARLLENRTCSHAQRRSRPRHRRWIRALHRGSRHPPTDSKESGERDSGSEDESL